MTAEEAQSGEAHAEAPVKSEPEATAEATAEEAQPAEAHAEAPVKSEPEATA